MHPLEKKAQRKFRNKVRRLTAKGIDVNIEGVIRTSASSPIPVRSHKLDPDQLYGAARKDMDIRVKLTDMARSGNTQAAKRRRQLNNWELNTKPAGPTDAWQPEQTRRAVGKCDVDAVKSLNKAKRGY